MLQVQIQLLLHETSKQMIYSVSPTMYRYSKLIIVIMVKTVAVPEVVLTFDTVGWFRLIETAHSQEFTAFGAESGDTNDAT